MDLSLADGIYPALVVALAYVVLGLTGFASSLIAVPLLAWRWPLAEVVPLALVMDMLASLLMGGLNLREVRWDEFRALAPGMLLGGLVGLWLAGKVTSAWPLLLLGAYIAGVAFVPCACGVRRTKVRIQRRWRPHRVARPGCMARASGWS